MNQELIGALVANSATLGVHWIYNPEYLEALSEKESLLFQKQNKTHYDLAKPSYYSYPNAEIGSFTLQGNILVWLYKGLKLNPNMTVNDYEDLLYSYLKPGGLYEGYVESYTKKMIHERLSKELNLASLDFIKTDDHLVGFIPYLVTRALNLPHSKAIELKGLFSTLDDYDIYYQMFDYIFLHINNMPIHKLLNEAIKLAPSKYQPNLEAALKVSDTKSFIKDYAGINCQIPQSIPLILHMLNKDLSYEETIEWNAKIGGASSDRGIILGALLSKKYEIPKSWISKINLPFLQKSK